MGTTSAERAVNAAKRFSGTRLNVGWEAGYQAQGLMQYAAPLWEELTGIHIDVLELGVPLDQFRRIAAEHRARTGSMDCAAIAPTWIPELLLDGALEPLDEYMARYMVLKDLEDYLPLYRDLGVSNGRRYGLFDDGDVLLLYYRKDLFDDASKKKVFAEKYGRPLGDPRMYDWRQFIDVARFFTESYAPDLYGLAPLTRELYWACFQYRLRVEGGEFFDSETMKTGVDTPAGLRALTQVNEMTKAMVPSGGMEPSLIVPLSTFLSGKCAMAIYWPPLALGAEQEMPSARMLESVPRSQIVGKTGYALLPDGVAQMAVGFVLSVLAHSQKKEAAYLFIQWLTSPEISLQRVMRWDTFRDPYRYSHIHAPEFRALWPTAGEYLDTLEKAASGAALLELIIPGAHEYQEAFYETLTNIRLGTPVETAVTQMAQSWERITERYGRARQRKAYAEFLKLKGATIPHARSTKAG
ncbi:extracellular solute-binding protein [Verrucomicrobiota bacterium sgz303538]